jgi:glutathione peroxidase-family protein
MIRFLTSLSLLALLFALLANHLIYQQVFGESHDFYAFNFTDVKGKVHQMSKYRGKVVLLFPSGTQDVFAPQLIEFEWLWRNYTDKLQVLTFPTNAFNLEPLKDTEIAKHMKSTWNVTFPIAQRQDTINPIFTHLRLHQDATKPVGWTFVKFAVDKTGHVRHRWEPMIKPLAFEKTLKQLMKENPQTLIEQRFRHERDIQTIKTRVKTRLKGLRRQLTLFLGRAYLRHQGTAL